MLLTNFTALKLNMNKQELYELVLNRVGFKQVYTFVKINYPNIYISLVPKLGLKFKAEALYKELLPNANTICKYCDAPTEFRSWGEGFAQYCSRECSGLCPILRKQIKNSNTKYQQTTGYAENTKNTSLRFTKGLDQFLLRLTDTSLIYVSGYISMSSKALFKCSKCDATFEQYTKEAINGRCANKCNAKSWWSKSMIKRLPELADNIFVNGYNNFGFPLLECTSGHKMHNKTVSDVIRRGGCFTCLWDLAQVKRTTNFISIEEATKKLLEANLKLISYNGTTLLEYECFKGHYKKLVTVKSNNLQNLTCRVCQVHDTKARQLQEKLINETVVEYRGVKDSTINCNVCKQNYELDKKRPMIKCVNCWVNPNKHEIDLITERFKSAGLTVLADTDKGYLVKCLDKGHEFVRKHINKYAGCKVCAKRDRYTTPHRKLVEWLKRNKITFDVNKNGVLLETRKEVDIYIPSHKLIIEVDGSHWHSEKYGESSKKRKHRRKLVEDIGYRLLRFWDFEFENPKPMLSYLSSVLKLSTKKVFARKCTVEKIDNEVASEFLNTWHLQGTVNASVKYGLFNADKLLLAVMTFKRPHISKSYAWELARFCVMGGWSIPGGASKMFTAFLREYSPTSVVSYADKRYSEGNLYTHLGMQYSHTSEPGYFYVKSNFRISRYSAQKHKLEALMPIFDPALSEVLNMQANGYYRSFDCGQLIYYWGTKPTLTNKAAEPSTVKERILNETHAGQLTWEYHATELKNLKIVNLGTGKLYRKRPILYSCLKCSTEYFCTPTKAIAKDNLECTGCKNIELNKSTSSALSLNNVLLKINSKNPEIDYVSGYTNATSNAVFKHIPTNIQFECNVYKLITSKVPHAINKLIQSKEYDTLLKLTWGNTFTLSEPFKINTSLLHNCSVHGNLYTRIEDVKLRAAKKFYGCTKCNEANKKYINGKWEYQKDCSNVC